MTKPIWAIVANGSVARVLERSPAQPAQWTEKECLTHPQSRQQGLGGGHEPPGHSIAGRSGLAPRSDARDHDRHAFAQQVARTVGAAAAAHQISGLVVFASNPFLGDLLGHLDDASRKLVSASHPLDLTSLPLPELVQRMHGDFGV